MVTLEAILISMFVLNSQKQQNERDRIRADLDYQVNLKAHQEVMQLHRKVDLLQTIVSKVTGSGTGPGAPQNCFRRPNSSSVRCLRLRARQLAVAFAARGQSRLLRPARRATIAPRVASFGG